MSMVKKKKCHPWSCIRLCRLHVISVALQTRVKATEWAIGKVLMSMQKHSV